MSDSLSQHDQLQFTQHIGDLMRHRIPLSIGLRALAEEIPSKKLAIIFFNMSEELEEGVSIDEVLNRRASELPSYLTTILKAGNQSGQLDQNISQIATFMRQRAELRRAFLGALLYPSVILVFTLLIAILLLGVIAPKFIPIFSDFGVRLPLATACLFALSRLFTEGWWIIPAVLVAILITGYSLRKYPQPRYIALHIPVFGPMLRYYALAEFSLLLSMLIRNSVPLPDSLLIAGSANSDASIAVAASDLARIVQSGASLRDAVKDVPQLGMEFRNTISMATGTETLAASLELASCIFSAHTSLRLRVLSISAEPIVVIIAAVAVSFLIAALMMPLVNLLNALS